MDTTETHTVQISWTELFATYSTEQLEAALSILEPTRRKVLELHFLYKYSLFAITARLQMSTEETGALCREALRNFSSILASRNTRAMADN